MSEKSFRKYYPCVSCYSTYFPSKSKPELLYT